MEGLLEELDAALGPLAGAGVDREARLEIEFVRLRVDFAWRGDRGALRRSQTRTDLLGDRERDVALERNHVLTLTLVALSPQVAPRARVDQASIDANLSRGPRHRTLQDEAHGQLPRDSGQWLLGMAIGR